MIYLADGVYRERLANYLPPFMLQFPEIKEIMAAEDADFDNINSSIQKILDEAFIKDCSIYGIKRYESILGITPGVLEPLETRRVNVLMQWNSTIPYTYRTLLKKLEVLYGAGNYEVSGDLQRYYIHVIVHSELQGQKKILYTMLGRFLPMNMAFTAKNEVLRNFIIYIPEKMDVPVMEMRTFFHFWDCDILNGSRLLDGSVLLCARRRYNLVPWVKYNGIKMPVHVIADVPAVLIKGVLYHGRQQDIKAGTTYYSRVNFWEHTGSGQAGCRTGKTNMSFKAAIETHENIGEVSITYKRNLCYLDGSVLLDGSKVLNALYMEEEV